MQWRHHKLYFFILLSILPEPRTHRMCGTSAIMDVNDTFTHRLPVAAVNHTVSFNVRKKTKAEQLDLHG